MTSASSSASAEREFVYTLTGPEIEVAEVIRLAHMPGFSLMIEHQGETFTVRLTDTEVGLFLEGRGCTFEAAWRSLEGVNWPELDLRDRIAAFGKKVGSHLTVRRALDAIGCGDHCPPMHPKVRQALIDDGLIVECGRETVGRDALGPITLPVYDMPIDVHFLWCAAVAEDFEEPA